MTQTVSLASMWPRTRWMAAFAVSDGDRRSRALRRDTVNLVALLRKRKVEQRRHGG